MAVVALGGEPALEATGPAAAGEVDAAPLEFPLATAAQRAGDGETSARRGTGAPVDVPRGNRSRRDRSCCRAARSAGWTGEPPRASRACLAAALRGIDVPHLVVVHAVDGLEPGVYRWPDLSAPVRAGDCGASSTASASTRACRATRRSS